MVSFKERLKDKFGKKGPPAPVASSTPHPQPAAGPATSSLSPTLPEHLWNQAYDQAKLNDPSAVDAYEKILSARLNGQDPEDADSPYATDPALQQNKIVQDVDGRRVQMQQLVQYGLHKTAKDAEIKQGMGHSIQAVIAVKEIVNKAVQASPEAAVVWILMNPLTQASSNRQGIAYVVSRMDWYWNLSSLLLEENLAENDSVGLRHELEKVITQLYTKLLLYQMKSVCYYNRRRLSVFARDLIKWDNWEGEIGEIQAAEAAVYADSTQYNTLSIRTQLGAIAETARSQNSKLDSITSAVQEQTRQQESMHETAADNKCLSDLRLTDPRDDKKRIQETKGGLLKDSYRWVLENADFRHWRNDPQSHLLWIRGDPGKGKTMLMCGIIDELKLTSSPTINVFYFLFQATDSRINSAVAALRGLLYSIFSARPSLISHLRKRYDRAGKTIFEDANAWTSLEGVLTDILRDPGLGPTYLVVDALDECVSDLPKLLDLLKKQSVTAPNVKWLVSSRNWPDIEERLEQAGHKVRLSLELNEQSVSAAVQVFIEHKVSQLAQQKHYDERTRRAVLDHLQLNANDTFLWVALVCQDLEATSKRHVRKKLESFPPGLDSLYTRMIQHISKSDDAEVCQQILGVITLVYRPITLEELAALSEELQTVSDSWETTQELVNLCGSFLTLRDHTIYFVHQSARDFLVAKAANKIFPSGKEDTHHAIFVESLKSMSKTLQRNIYRLKSIGCSIEEAQPPDPDPLAALRYSCTHWVDHLLDSHSTSYREDLQSGGVVDTFLNRKYLYWLEALSLCRSIPKGVVSMATLQSLVQHRGDANAFTELVYDAYRFAMYHNRVIEISPLQAYASSLLFSPSKSLVRSLFKHEEPNWITILPATSDGWSTCLQTLEGHISDVSSVAFSHDSTRLASASIDSTVKIWDSSSGACLQTLEGHSRAVWSVAFSHDSTRLASASYDSTVKIWDASSGACLQTLKGHSSSISFVAFSHDSMQLASASDDSTVKIWDSSSGACLQTLEGHSSDVRSVAFSHDSTRLASASDDSTVKIWDASSGACLQTLKGHSSWVNSVAFSHDSTRLASASYDSTVKIWDSSSGACLQTLKGHRSDVRSVAFSHDSTRLASASDDSTVKIWDISSGACLQTLEGHSGSVRSVAFSHDSTRLASASYDSTVKIWDSSSGACLQMLEGHSSSVRSIVFSHDSMRLASASDDSTVKIWDSSSGTCLQTLKGHSSDIRSVAFSHDSTWLASASDDSTVKIWDSSSGACLQTLEGHSRAIWSVAFSHDSTRLASASYDSTVKIWDSSSGACLQTLEGHSSSVRSVAFSHDSTRLASASDDRTVKIWDSSSGACLQTLEGHSSTISSVVFSHNSTRLASASYDSIVKIWDPSSAVCLQTLTIGRTPFNLSLDSSRSLLHTEFGDITISTSAGLELVGETAPQQPEFSDIGVGLDFTWITYNGKNALWVPSEYRGWISSVCGNKVAIGTGSGRVWICTMDVKVGGPVVDTASPPSPSTDCPIEAYVP